MPSKSSSSDAPVLPSLRHFTVDPNRKPAEDEVISPAAGMSVDDSEKVKALNEKAREAFEQREADEKQAADQAAKSDEPAPKPSAVVNVPAGAAPDTAGQVPEPEGESSSSSSRSSS